MKSLSDFSSFFCSFVEFLKQIKRIYVFSRYSFIIFLWSVFSFNEIIDDSFVDFFSQDFLHFIDFVVIEKFRRKILWYDVVVFSFLVRFQVENVKYIMNAIKWVTWSQNWVSNMSSNSTQFNPRIEQEFLFNSRIWTKVCVQTRKICMRRARFLRIRAFQSEGWVDEFAQPASRIWTFVRNSILRSD